MNRMTVLYHLDAAKSEIEARAQALAIEQSVEMPLEAIDDDAVRHEVVGRVLSVQEGQAGGFDVRLGLALGTLRPDIGQLVNMLFGNSSILDHVRLVDAEFPKELLANYSGPRFGINGLRQLLGARHRALTATAIKPLGLSADRLAELCRRFAEGGIDVIKDDHGMGNQDYAPFAKRVAACQKAVAGTSTLYAPHLTGTPRSVAEQIRVAKGEGVGMVMMSPMLLGMPVVQEMVAEHLTVPVLAHPAMAGAARIAPPLLLGKLFRLIGADAIVYPNHGGRFGYSPATCRELAGAAKAEWGGLSKAFPVPAGGMTLERVPEMLAFYGNDVMLLIGGALLLAKDALVEKTQEFVAAVAAHSRKEGS